MIAPAFIEGLQARGATLRLEDGKLRVSSATALTDADRAAWQQHKREIIACLETASTREVTPLMPESLAGIPGIEYSTERGEWIRRINGAVWRVPHAKSPPAPVEDDFSEAREFLRSVRAARKSMPPALRNATEAEQREFVTAAACLACGIEPADFSVSLACSLQPQGGAQ